jgi:hypothetical protein
VVCFLHVPVIVWERLEGTHSLGGSGRVWEELGEQCGDLEALIVWESLEGYGTHSAILVEPGKEWEWNAEIWRHSESRRVYKSTGGATSLAGSGRVWESSHGMHNLGGSGIVWESSPSLGESGREVLVWESLGEKS